MLSKEFQYLIWDLNVIIGNMLKTEQRDSQDPKILCFEIKLMLLAYQLNAYWSEMI